MHTRLLYIVKFRARLWPCFSWKEQKGRKEHFSLFPIMKRKTLSRISFSHPSPLCFTFPIKSIAQWDGSSSPCILLFLHRWAKVLIRQRTGYSFFTMYDKGRRSLSRKNKLALFELDWKNGSLTADERSEQVVAVFWLFIISYVFRNWNRFIYVHKNAVGSCWCDPVTPITRMIWQSRCKQTIA